VRDIPVLLVTRSSNIVDDGERGFETTEASQWKYCQLPNFKVVLACECGSGRAELELEQQL
jgi:hypothetical protein